jgi:hypothetical protein
MPVFVLKAKDKLATSAIRAYHASCLRAGLTHQAKEVMKAHQEIRDWQRAHPDEMKLPDHDHRSAGEPGSGSDV